jgi:hypothetical protein
VSITARRVAGRFRIEITPDRRNDMAKHDADPEGREPFARLLGA